MLCSVHTRGPDVPLITLLRARVRLPIASHPPEMRLYTPAVPMRTHRAAHAAGSAAAAAFASAFASS